MYYVISELEFRELNHRGEVSAKLAGFWQDMISKLPNDLKVEAMAKSFRLKDHPVLGEENTSFSRNLYFHVESATNQLRAELLKPDNSIICIHE